VRDEDLYDIVDEHVPCLLLVALQVHGESFDIRDSLLYSFLTVISVRLLGVRVLTKHMRSLVLRVVFTEVPDRVFLVRPEVPQEIAFPVLQLSFFLRAALLLGLFEVH